MNPTRGNSSPKWNSTFATARRAVFQLALNKIHDETLRAAKFFGQANAQLYASGHALSKDARFFQNGPSNDGWKPPARDGRPVNPNAPPPGENRSLRDG